jgi:hypothetical protein
MVSGSIATPWRELADELDWWLRRNLRERSMITVNLELMGETIEEYYGEQQLGTVEASLYRQLEAGELPK